LSSNKSEKEELNRITQAIIGAAIEAHKHLGPGLLESAYEACAAFELIERGLQVEQQKPLPLVYKDVRLDCGYRLDLLVEGKVIVEIKAVDNLLPIHEA
jgi:GxxExxY protein